MKIGEHVLILNKKGIVDDNNPNCEGRIEDISVDGKFVFITNMNMPYMGSYAMERIPAEKIISK
jgi:hypothetical protein